jgi:hypothetical protein
LGKSGPSDSVVSIGHSLVTLFLLRPLTSASQRTVHGAERTADALTERGDDGDARDKNESQHHRVFNSSGTIFADKESGDRGKEASHEFGTSELWDGIREVTEFKPVYRNYPMSDMEVTEQTRKASQVVSRQHSAREERELLSIAQILEHGGAVTAKGGATGATFRGENLRPTCSGVWALPGLDLRLSIR